MILVVGPGRSGTSITCHVLSERFGVDFGEVPRPTRANPLGAYEDTPFREANRRYQTGEIGRGEWRARVSAMVAAKDEPWGWKDPRAGDFLGELIPLLPDPRIVWCRRPLEACVASRMRWGSVSEREIKERFRRRLRLIEGALMGRPFLALDFSRRYSERELARALAPVAAGLAAA